MHFQGLLFRALNPVYARDPLSGRGAELHGGRFNAKGTAALYLALDHQTALNEVNQAGSFQPTTLVSYEADIQDVFDTREAGAFDGRNITGDDLGSSSWRHDMLDMGIAPTQAFAAQLIAEGHNGILVPSFAPGSKPEQMNLVLWSWSDSPPNFLRHIDDEGRLAKS